ncbi:MAG: hypothetical protein MJZ23_10350, partial [Paludibacteraceae bacterium]|nr:hypothetical protein [Paludibacteraceae bacterium]
KAGKVTAALNGTRNVWHQTLGYDSVPMLNFIFNGYLHGSDELVLSSSSLHTEPDNGGNHDQYFVCEDGHLKCSVCGETYDIPKINNVYQISNARDLFLFGRMVNSKQDVYNAKLTSDIDLSTICSAQKGRSWQPIGNSTTKYYSGTFDGDGHTINGLYIASGTSVGLFGYVSEATIKNLCIKGSVKGTSNVAGLIGTSERNTNVERCINFASVKATTSHCGGLIGMMYHASLCKITASGNVGTIDGPNYVGGLVGYSSPFSANTMKYCYNFGSVKATSSSFGHLVGYISDESPINSTNAYNSEAMSPTNTNGIGNAKAFSVDEFTSGAVTYFLNSDKTYWYQNIGIDKYPVLKGKTVYKGYAHGTTILAFANNKLHDEPDANGSHDAHYKCKIGEAYKCEVCDKAYELELDNDCYLIHDANELAQFAYMVNDGDRNRKAKLMADIDLSEICSSSLGSWRPITSYSGDFDGNGKTIKGLYIGTDNSDDYAGLFGLLVGGSIKNLTVEGSINANNLYVGGIVGRVNQLSTNATLQIVNCVNKVSINCPGSDKYVGGIVGYSEDVAFEKCINMGDINANNCYVGGIAGAVRGRSSLLNKSVTVDYCANVGNLKGKYVGGIVGTSPTFVGIGLIVDFSNCYVYGNLSSTDLPVNEFIGNCNNGSSSTNSYYNQDAYMNVRDYIGTSVSKEDFANGKLTYDLNTLLEESGRTTAWFQTLGQDSVPMFSGDKVYGVYNHGENDMVYSNTKNGFHTEPDVDGSHDKHYDVETATGFLVCGVCGNTSLPELNIENGVCLISTTADMLSYANLVKTNNKVSAKLMNDIDLSGICNADKGSWTPIGSSTNPYAGTFDGNNHIISGLYINTTEENQALFGTVSASTIKNLTVYGDVNGYDNVAGIVAKATAAEGRLSKITNCKNHVNVSGHDNVGGLGGYTFYSEFNNCTNYGSIIGSNNRCGGIASYCHKVENCANYGKIEGMKTVASLIGEGYSSGQVVNSYNYNLTNASNPIGASNVAISNCYYLSDNETEDGGRTADQFANGMVAYELGEAWGQTIGTDDYPVLGGDKVYGVYNHGENDMVYSNTKTGFHTEPDEDGSHKALCNIDVNSGNLICSVCGKKFSPELNVVDGICQISTPVDLIAFRALVNGGKASSDAILLNDIDLSDICNADKGSWTPIGSTSNAYNGHFNGGNFTISGLYINKSTDKYQGLFGYVASATIENITIKGYVRGGEKTGAIAGFVKDGATFNNCLNYATVNGGSQDAGGIAGHAIYAIFTNCENHGNVSGVKRVAGIVGYGHIVEKCINYGTINGTSSNIGGIVGNCLSKGRLIACANVGTIDGKSSSSNVGGLVGYADGSTIKACYNAGSLTGGSATGPIYGAGSATINSCYYNSEFYEKNSASATGLSTDFFASGRVAYEMNSKAGQTYWFQTIGTDAYPVLAGDKVFKCQETYYNEGAVVEDFNVADMVDFNVEADFSANNVSYTRNVTANWGTLCLPFSFSVENNTGADYYYIKNLTDSIIILGKYTGIVEAGQPVIFYAEEAGSLTITSGDVNFTAEMTANAWEDLVGTYVADTVGSMSDFYLKDNKFYQGKGQFIVDPFRAYIEGIGNNGVNSLHFMIDDDVVEENVNADATIVAIFNLAGQRVSNMRDGATYILKMSDDTTRKVIIR